MKIKNGIKMEKINFKFLYKLIYVGFLLKMLIACASETKESCRKKEEIPLLQSCIINRANSDGSPILYSDEICIFSLIEYSNCSEKRSKWP